MLKFFIISLSVMVVSYFVEVVVVPSVRNKDTSKKILREFDTAELFTKMPDYDSSIQINNSDIPIDYVMNSTDDNLETIFKQVSEVAKHEYPNKK